MTTYAEDALEYAQLMGRLLKTYKVESQALIEVEQLMPQNMKMAWQVYDIARRENWTGSPLGRFCSDLPEIWEHVAWNTARPEDHDYLKESLAELRKALKLPEKEPTVQVHYLLERIDGSAHARLQLRDGKVDLNVVAADLTPEELRRIAQHLLTASGLELTSVLEGIRAMKTETQGGSDAHH